MAQVTEEEVREALQQVSDPELGHSIVDLGLIYNVEIDEGNVKVEMTLTSMGCPAGPQIMQEAHTVIERLEGVEDVDIQLVWRPQWSPDMMSEDLKWMFGRM